MRLQIANYNVRGVYTFKRGTPQHYKDVHVIATSIEDARARAVVLGLSNAKAVYVQRVVA